MAFINCLQFCIQNCAACGAHSHRNPSTNYVTDRQVLGTDGRQTRAHNASRLPPAVGGGGIKMSPGVSEISSRRSQDAATKEG